MRILNVRMLFGTEIILKYNNLFQQLLDKSIIDSINCAICEETVRIFRDTFDSKFAEKYTDIAKLIMTDSRINVTTVDNIEKVFPYDEQFKKCLDPKSIEVMFNTTETYHHSGLIDKSIDTGLPEKYITISSKCLNVPKSDYDINKQTIFNILNSLDIPIVILGERESKNCVEYDTHETYSIYDDLISNLRNTIDLSIPSSENNNDIDPLKKTFKVVNESMLNIFISTAGVKRVVVYNSDNVLGLVTTDFKNFSEGMKNRPNSESVTIVSDFENFIKSLTDKINHIKHTTI